MTTKIDLRKCKPGDKLRIRTTKAWKNASPFFNPPTDIITYVGPTDELTYLDHMIKYSTGAWSTRTHDGRTFPNNPKVDDPDVLEIIGS